MEEQKRIYQIITISWQWVKTWIVCKFEKDEDWDKLTAEGDAIINNQQGTESEKKLMRDIILALMDYLARRSRNENR